MEEVTEEVISAEDEIDELGPASHVLQELDEEKRILSSVYRHVEHQQAVEQVAGVAGAVLAERALSSSAHESQSPSSPWLLPLVHKTPSIPIAGSEGSESVSGGVPMRLSLGPESAGAGDISRKDCVEELLELDPSLDSALRINMTLQMRFRDRVQKLDVLLKKNLERQAVLKEEISNAKYLREQEQKIDGSGKVSLRITHFCVPYFKNRSGMPAPMNDDAKMKVNNGYIDLYVTRPRTWLTVEKDTLDDIVRKEWRELNIKRNEMSIRELECKLQHVDPEDQKSKKGMEKGVKEMKNFVKKLETAPLTGIVPDRGEKRLDWDRIAARGFDGHRSAEECRLHWENLIHPAINQEPFTENEDLIIHRQRLNGKMKAPDWEKIAADMNSNRTAFQVMQRYVSFIEPTMKPNRWTKKDIDKLLHTINMLRVGSHIPWAQVHQHMVGFSRGQIQSKWRMIDPEASKGPFTVEEDFILIKGLHMFGLNFESISHFMPGRTFSKVRDRYKRTIFPLLATKPWTIQEDDIMIKNCSVGSKNWRKMIVDLPRFDACQIRARYHIIQVWQTISGTNVLPPPLFPVTATVKHEKIQEVRKALITDASNLKLLVDESRKGINLKNLVKELEERRLVIKERKMKGNLKRIKKVTEKRGRQPGTPNPHHKHIQDIFLTEFFIPYRASVAKPSLTFSSVQHTLKSLSKVLQLKILKQVTESEACQLRTLGFTDMDLQMVESLTEVHTLIDDNKCASNCAACEPAQPERMPALPPCKTTVGAFRSLLVHRPKLNEMASREFFLHKYNKKELLTLEANFKGKGFKKRPNYRSEPEILCTSEQGNQMPGYNSDSGTAVIEYQVRIKPESSEDQDPMSVENQGSGANQTTFHITRQMDSQAGRKRSPQKRRINPAEPSGVKAYSRGRGLKPETAETSSSTTMHMKMEINSRGVKFQDRSSTSENPSQGDEKARKASDALLFQRMLSIFFWPATLTLPCPPKTLIGKVNEKIESGDLPRPNTQSLIPKQFIGKDEFAIKDQVKYINFLSEMETQHNELVQVIREKKNKMKTEKEDHIQQMSEKKNESKPVRGTQSKESAEAHVSSVEEEDSGTNGSEEDRGESDAPPSGNQIRFMSKVSQNRKKNLKSLRRSLVMKKIWDARRKGSYPQRTSNRNKRNYTPRGSRTRDCVRLEMLKPPKDPRPWDFPLDGPLRVQPQVPVVPSEEMLGMISGNSQDIPQTSTSYPKISQPQTPPESVEQSAMSTSTPDVITQTNSSEGLNVGTKRRKRQSKKKHIEEVTNGEVLVVNPSSRITTTTNYTMEEQCITMQEGNAVTYDTKPTNIEVSSTVAEIHASDSLEVKESTCNSSVTPITSPKTKSNKRSSPLRKKVFEASFQNLLDDQIKIEDSGTHSQELQVKRSRRSTGKKSFQVSFQNWIDDTSIDSPEKEPGTESHGKNAGQKVVSVPTTSLGTEDDVTLSEAKTRTPPRKQQMSSSQTEVPIQESKVQRKRSASQRIENKSNTKRKKSQ